MSDTVKTNYPGYVKNKKTNVVINTDINQYQNYLRQVNKSKEFQAMKAQVEEMREMLALLLEKSNQA
jgi:hypothetical protein